MLLNSNDHEQVTPSSWSSLSYVYSKKIGPEEFLVSLSSDPPSDSVQPWYGRLKTDYQRYSGPNLKPGDVTLYGKNNFKVMIKDIEMGRLSCTF